MGKTFSIPTIRKLRHQHGPIPSKRVSLTISRVDSVTQTGHIDGFTPKVSRSDTDLLLQVWPLRNRLRITRFFAGTACFSTSTIARAEAALQESERSLRMVIETIPALVWSAAPDGEPDYINQRLTDYTGKTLDDFVQSRWASLVHPDDLDMTVKAWQHSVETGMTYEVEHRLRRQNGAYRWFRVQGEPLRDKSGRVVHWYGLHIDIEDRKQAEQMIRERENHLRTIVEAIPAIVSRSTPAGKLEYVNQRGLEYFGGTLEQIGFHSIHPDDRDGHLKKWLVCLDTGEPYESTYRVRRADGVYRWFYVGVEPLRDQEGRVASWYAVNIDIDESKQMEEALRSTQRKLSAAMQIAAAELSASIAHEINQPLAAIVANGHACQTWLSSDPPNIERAQLTAERISRDANSAAQVVQRIRGLFKHARPTKTPVSINDIIGETLSLLAEEINGRVVTTEVDLDRELPVILADPVQIQQLIVNLVRNAIEAMEGVTDCLKHLKVTSQREDTGTLSVRIHDRGRGIVNPQTVFEPFFTTKERGMGLGLSICRSITEAHGGRLWSAPNTDAGTTFTFTLPLEPEVFE
jgi:PAS domain S-box-containing protein